VRNLAVGNGHGARPRPCPRYPWASQMARRLC
jgi:hypothetical protein